MQVLNYLATRLVRWKEKLDLLLILGLLFLPTYNYIAISLRILQQITMAGILSKIMFSSNVWFWFANAW